MISPTSHLDQVNWKTIANSIVMIDAVTYQLTVVAIDPNDKGYTEKVVGYYLKDFIGNTYSISAINVDSNVDRIEVKDDFLKGQCPQSGRPAIVYKSVGNGKAPYLAPIHHRYLDLSALDNSRIIELDILWKNKGDVGKLEYPTDFSTASVSHDFKNVFKEVPEGRENIRVYRKDQPAYEGASELRDTEVPWHTLIVDNEHFELTIDTTITPDLTGVIVYFNFNSAT